MMGRMMGHAARLPYATGGVKIICEGNSLMAGYGKETGVPAALALSIPQHLAAMPFLAQASIVNLAVGGSTWKDDPADKNMSGTARLAALAAQYDPTKQHVLILWESTNAPFNNTAYTGQDVALQSAAYIALARTKVPGARIVLLTTIPRYGFGGPYLGNYAAGNIVLTECDNYTKANWRDMGIDALVDVRSSGKLVASGTEYMAQAMKPYQMDGCHLNGGGYGLVADMLVGPLRSLIKR